MGLTADDRLDIFELPAKYADALDLLEPERLHAVFTDDAVWQVDERDLRLVGIDEIKAFMGRPDVHPGAHLMTNLYIDRVDETDAGTVVHLRSRGIFPTGESDPRNPTFVFYGRYEDEVVHTEDGWRIRLRRYAFGS